MNALKYHKLMFLGSVTPSSPQIRWKGGRGGKVKEHSKPSITENNTKDYYNHYYLLAIKRVPSMV